MLHDWTRLAASLLIPTSVLLLLAAAGADLACRRIPNAVPGLLAVIGLGLRLCNGSVLGGLAAAALVFVCGAFCWRRGWLGGADVKLLAAAALLVPPHLVAGLVLAVTLAGGVLALLYLLLPMLLPASRQGARAAGRHWAGRRIARILTLERLRIKRHGPLPYAAAIAAGTLFVLIKQ